MKRYVTVEALSKGGRSGTVKSPDNVLDLTLGNAFDQTTSKRGPSPELLFAGAYSACYHEALLNAGKKLNVPIEDSTVRTLVSLMEDDLGGYSLAVELHAQVGGLARPDLQRLMEEAHRTCPYSKALRGVTTVTLVPDCPAETTETPDWSHPMKTSVFQFLHPIALAAALLAAGCVVHERAYRAEVGGEVVVGDAPPAPIVETVTVAPDPTYVWIGGSWVWRNHWVWESGRWARPPHRGAVWVPHSYVNRGGRHVWIRGGWR